MDLYQPSSEVESGFEGFLQALYAETEDAIATTSFTNFFTPQGALIVLGNKAVGVADIVALKEYLMPTDGSKIWDHFPNVTTVYSETDLDKTYAVEGVIETTYIAELTFYLYSSYSSRFTVAKKNGDVPDLKSHSGSLITYDDLVVDPAYSPTSIPCYNFGAKTCPSSKVFR
ncbi:hypothetical protein INS49_006282 [Diaporthe citri]|uniref:uncharacterized protein n=1 Tax=Diaporthe citri TaxID=83186 RepID=UPI001C82513E|nr:uncharacterized protein INS49_006282 [Diaporthe citri]KAG6364678.1 hypothetical protein INS49_006282 [Diaporthe citri]